MGSVYANFVPRGLGPSKYNPALTIQGPMFFHIGAIFPVFGGTLQFASLYFHDTEFSSQSRVCFQRTLDEDILRELAKMLDEFNKLVK